MSDEPSVKTPVQDRYCSIERTLGIVGDRWSFLILREALVNNVSRFADFEAVLHIAPNILSTRLARMSEAGVLSKQEYREEGARPRMSYQPTEAGRQLMVVLAALQQWGDDYVPPARGVTQLRETRDDHAPVRVGFVRDPADLIDVNDIEWPRTAAHPANWKN
jgi:DNA-binding HxlR family transcriptional regulator